MNPVDRILTPGSMPKRYTNWQVSLIVFLIALSAVIRLADLYRPAARSVDEAMYTWQARVVCELGLFKGGRTIAHAYLSRPNLSLFPAPTRIGYIIAIALVMKLTGDEEISVGAWISAIASILSIVLVVLIGLEFFEKWAVVVAIALLTVFPLDLIVASHAWADSLVGFLCLSIFYITMKIAAGSARSAAWYIGMAMLSAIAIAVKESCLLICAPCLVVCLGVVTFRDRSKRLSWILIGATALAAIGDAALWYSSTGRDTIELMLQEARAGAHNAYIVKFSTGPAWILPAALWSFAPATFGLAVIGLLYTLLPIHVAGPDRSGAAQRALAGATLGVTALFAFLPYGLNLRYMTPTFGPFCLFAGTGLLQLFQVLRRRMGRKPAQLFGALSGAILLVSLLSNYQQFVTFNRLGCVDLTARDMMHPATEWKSCTHRLVDQGDDSTQRR